MLTERSTKSRKISAAKDTKKCVVAEGLTFDDYKTCLVDGETVNKLKIALNRDDDKRLV